MDLPTSSDVIDAAERIARHVRRTPLLESESLNRELRGRIMFKPESLQSTGSFKVRGAYNRMLQLSTEERGRGIVAWSAGNHAQALALTGRELGVPVCIVMPNDAPTTKIENTRRLGAEVVLHDRVAESREEIGTQLAREKGAIIVPPFEDRHVIAGQGTVGLESLQDMLSSGAMPDRLVTPVGGGGLMAGCALAVGALGLPVAVYGAEPEDYDCTRRSLLAGSLVQNEMNTPSLADALLVRQPGEMTFEINRRLVAGGFAVSETDLVEAVRFAYSELRLVVEPGGAAALAAVLANPGEFVDLNVLVVLSGGNVDPSTFTSILKGAA